MQKLTFQKEIDAPAQKVYETMLGLQDKSTYEYWAATFNSTSTYEGSWGKGSKILFVGCDENGKRGGMVSEVDENQPGKLVSVRHFGFVDGDEEITTGEQVEKWAGGYEIYHFEEHNGKTTVIVELDTIDEFKAYFEDKYPQAMDKLKEACEK
ncbi:SRPBCC family protein [Sphingobacterium bovistauri]|uniref:SRPBCC domain-containing protein n=1 Tax=Sphingobacterium bovistauri TaxID=2781959 RepID=A0ABS7Z825_9SPHI|nr:SRPBCC domain-containing protein [Sphingobacterium bovistauri]MCA5006352.1 SRPBCC domain-containing protein [Sphingobacterium bovistauri]